MGDARSLGRVLVVDDTPEMAETLADGLRDRGYEATPISNAPAALQRIREGDDEVLITDLRMPEVDGLVLLSTWLTSKPGRPAMVMTAFGAIDSAIESIQRGAYHYLTKPFKLEELLVYLERSLAEMRLRAEAESLRLTLRPQGLPGLLGGSPAIRNVIEVAERVAKTAVPVLLLGETGTGKSLLARAIHGASSRSARPFVAVNCAALPEALLESELFGHVKGAFTGATADRPGLFAEADGGTLFLDEIGEMSPALQAKLLHALERSSVRPVGASRDRQIDVRLLAATHRDLRERVRSGSFREDLLYRLEVVAIAMPALRERREDIPALVAHFIRESRARHPQSPVLGLHPQAMAALLEHPWPGNLRELSHAIERVVVLGQKPQIEASELPLNLAAAEPARGGPPLGREVLPIREVQQIYSRWALEQVGGHRGRAAERLGVDGKTLAKWLAQAQRGDRGS